MINTRIARILPIVILLIYLWLPVVVFVSICGGIFLLFLFGLNVFEWIFASEPYLLASAWLLLLLLYIALGVIFTRFEARHIRRVFADLENHIQRRLIFLSGLPFYVLCILCAVGGFLSDNAASIFVVGVVGGLGFALTSLGYLILMHFFSARSQAAGI